MKSAIKIFAAMGLDQSTAKGGLPCHVCGGKRMVQSGLKGKIGKAKLKRLRKAKQTLAKMLATAQDFKMKDDLRKTRKAYAAMLKPGERDFPALKNAVKHMDKVLTGLDLRILDIETNQKQALGLLRFNLRYYLTHEIAVLDLCIARAEFNEKAAKK